MLITWVVTGLILLDARPTQTRVARILPGRCHDALNRLLREMLWSTRALTALSGLARPALVVHGESDPIPLETAAELARLLEVPLQRIPACGHVPYVEAPEAFTRLLDAFLPKGA